jgi:tol-pal system protein YbgF
MSSKTVIKRVSRSRINILAVLLILVISWGCGASRQSTNLDGEEEINIDELLGEEEMSAADRASEEAEVLRLLGITPEEDRLNQSQISTLQQDSEPSSLQTEVSQLKQDLEQKDIEISSLRSQLTDKESKITVLESRLQSTDRRRSFSTRSGSSSEPSEAFKSRYQYALNQFNARNYQEALSIFSELLSQDANNSLSDNCQYWIGESYYGLGDYNQAISAFEKVFSFPNSNKSDDAQLKLGISYLKLGDRQQARAEFERLLANYPDSEYVGLAQRYLSRL